MYESFFRLNNKPFELLPDPEFFYLSPAHRKALTYLEYGIREHVGFILLTGEVGSGKTTIIKNLQKGLDKGITTAKIFNTNVTAEQLLALINADFGLSTTGRDKVTLFAELYEFLIKEFVAGRHCLLLIDEAQNLAPDCLEEVRMLSNLETENAKLLQIILVGQPELREILAANDLRQLRQRISVNCHITPLDREQAEAYILHRLERAGNRQAIAFSAEAFDNIHHHTRGIPRLINILCDFLLVAAYVDESKSVSGEIVREVVSDLRFEQTYWNAGDSVDTYPRTEPGQPPDPAALNKLEQLSNRLAVLEEAAAAFAQLDEVTAVSSRCEQLEKSLTSFHRQLESIAAGVPVSHSPIIPSDPVDTFPATVPQQRKGFLQALFRKS